jgi:hypothetical protein
MTPAKGHGDGRGRLVNAVQAQWVRSPVQHAAGAYLPLSSTQYEKPLARGSGSFRVAPGAGAFLSANC